MGRDTTLAGLFSWSPADFLSDPLSTQTSFLYPGPQVDSLTLRYTLQGSSGEGCLLTDTVLVQVLPQPAPAPIRGSQSVCPGVDSVAYWLENPEPGTLVNWQVSGGVIVGGNQRDTVLIRWGETNAQARVEAELIHPVSGCRLLLPGFPVRVEVELATPSPAGPTILCLEDRFAQQYAIPLPTNGSVFTWNLIGGSILAGQGSPVVTVNWDGAGVHSLWVRESSTTVDTVCFGNSDTLRVEVVVDPIEVELVAVGVANEQDTDISISMEWTPWVWPPDQVWLRREAPDGDTTLITLPDTTTRWTDSGLLADEGVFAYELLVQHRCRDLSPPVHQTIHLSGQTDTTLYTCNLSWTPYGGWPVKEYLLYYQRDGQANELIARLGSARLDTVLPNGLLGFQHRYRIVAQGWEAGQVSASNDILLAFDHQVRIPNVFSPNGDGIHDRWVIQKIHLFPDNRVWIYDRWGREVFRANGYANEWQGTGCRDGVYFYALTIGEGSEVIRGSVTLVR